VCTAQSLLSRRSIMAREFSEVVELVIDDGEEPGLFIDF
jgi:hypothetical protein